MNRDTELLKTQVYAGYCHSEFRSRISYVFGAMVAVYVSLMGLFLQKAIDVLTYYFSLAVGAPFFALLLWSVYREYHNNLDRIDKLIQQVNKGEPLPSLRELRKKHKVKLKHAYNLENMEISEQASSFYAGVIVGVIGNLLVSCIIEMSNARFENKPFGIFAFWTFGFIASSVIFFQLTKFIMRRFGTPQIALRFFDLATVILAIVGILVIIIRV